MGKDIKKFLESKKCFKLICGAGNKNNNEITNLCALYAAAGCRFFDINASIESLKAAKKGLKYAGKDDESFICISIGTKDDPHLSKCSIVGDKCVSCGACKNSCSQQAINSEDSIYKIIESNCIGCGKCIDVCPNSAIERCFKDISFSEILPQLIAEGIDCVEYHAVTDSENIAESGWNEIIKIYRGPLSVCISRALTGNKQIIERLSYMKQTAPSIFMVQADGTSMSGGEDNYRSTLQAVAMADIVEKAEITPYIIMSGGTNTKTMDLARQCDISVSGCAVGSYARNIVKKYIQKEDFLQDKKTFDEALKIAKKLVNKV